ncbi:LOW QUALITY PROTEIN: peptidyl-prolyl cis-trans isomerase FKBP4-like [Macrobrachium rosenbergii]|uniref:LOW QUALITY PROTEIN: peptidyl-prolyl cis-trans isomerase FKBP4-like n=1 Tax=Macrobrachium rosenbergii TaxID=79674 RepID=UPI0034D3FAAE
MGGEETNLIDLTPNKDGGVLKEILRSGEGEEGPLQGDKVFVHYVGTLEDGSKFDSSRDRGDKFSFTLGKGEVIKAWDLGVASMKKGELARLTCASAYAYGENGSPPKIPPNSTLIFEIELFEWRGEDLSPKEDGGIIRRNIKQGEGYQTPNDGAIVDVHVVGRVNGTVFDEREVKFPLGEGTEHNIPEGLERAIERFKKGEKSSIRLAPKYAFGSAGNPSLNVPPGASLEYEVELRSFEKAKESWEMDQEEKIDQAKVCKDRGTLFFKQDKFRLAVKQYKKIIDLLQYDSGLDDEKKAESHSVLLAGHLNLAMTYLKLKDNSHAREHATKALELDSSNIKALFRRGQANLNMGDAVQAQKDFQACLDLEETKKKKKNKLQICSAESKLTPIEGEVSLWGMFENFLFLNRAREEAEAKRNKDVMGGDLGEWGNAEEKSDSGKVDLTQKLDIENVEML